jgi:3-deoxy-D-arabino-heptulosonate 7-phosphate (DAHP) synthase class II
MEPVSTSDNPAIKAKVAAYLLLNREIADRKAAQEDIKRQLDPYLREAETNARGSHVIPFSEPLEVAGKQYASLQKTKKVSKVLNEQRALDFLSRDQAFEAAIVTVQHVDQDVLWDLFVQDMISQEELDSFFDTTVSYSFNPTRL